MKTIHLPLLIMLAAIPLNIPAQTESQQSAPGVLRAQTKHHLQATVEDINYNTREVTLKGPEGNSVRLAISDEVKNFPQIKKGDRVNVGYFESIALAVAKPGENLQPTSRTAVSRRQPGQKPGGAAVSTMETTATVEDIDRENREVTLKGPEGNTVKVAVDPSVGDLQRINKGDQIRATLTRALAISVDDPNARARGGESESK